MTLEEINNYVWYVAFTHWRSERRARSNLEMRGFQTMMPTCLVQVSHAGKKLIEERPMFPRYVFVGVKPPASWYPILSSVGVSALVGANKDSPTRIPTWIMRNLFHAQETGAFSTKVATIPGKVGDKVRFVGGNFGGFVGTIQRASPAKRVQVVIKMFGRQTDFSVPLAQLEAA